MGEEVKIKKSDIFPNTELAPRWLAEEFEILETQMVSEVPAGQFVIVPAVTKSNFEKTGKATFDQRKKYSEVIIFVNHDSVPEEFKPRE